MLKERRFSPLFVAQFLGAFNDNLFKTALVVMLAYGVVVSDMASPETLVTVAAGIFILPFAILTPLGGDIADKFDKARVIRAVKLCEIIIAVLAVAAIATGSVLFLLFVLFLFGAQSAIFSPSKFSILPQHLAETELIAGNALVNTATYLAILAGTIVGTLLVLSTAGQVAVCFMLLVCAAIGYIASRFIPKAPAPEPDLDINYNLPLEAVRIVRYARKRGKGVFTAIIGNSWFFFVGGLYLSQMPNYASHVLKVDNHVLTFFLTMFSVGVGIGGLLNNQLLHGEVKATFVPWAAIGIALFSLDLFFATSVHDGLVLRDIWSFLSDAQGWRITFDLLFVAICGGLYAVPLKTIVQARTPKDFMARTVAAGALLDALFVLLAAVVAVVVYALGFDVHHLFILVALLSIPATLYIKKLSNGFVFWKDQA